MAAVVHERANGGGKDDSDDHTSRRRASSRRGAPLIELERVEKVYRTGKLEYPALRGIDLTIEEGEMVAIVGPSGSGKTTIMNMITGIDRPTAGTVDGRRAASERDERGAARDLARPRTSGSCSSSSSCCRR